jgi:hypothetical protein
MKDNESKCPIRDVPLKTQYDENNYPYEISPKCNKTFWTFPPISESNAD